MTDDSPYFVSYGERRVLEAIVDHGSLKAAAAGTGLAESTVKNHVHNMSKRNDLTLYQLLYKLGAGEL